MWIDADLVPPPKDGSYVDGYGWKIVVGKRVFERVPDIRWSAFDNAWLSKPVARYIEHHITHWMPIPRPPQK